RLEQQIWFLQTSFLFFPHFHSLSKLTRPSLCWLCSLPSRQSSSVLLWSSSPYKPTHPTPTFFCLTPTQCLLECWTCSALVAPLPVCWWCCVSHIPWGSVDTSTRAEWN